MQWDLFKVLQEFVVVATICSQLWIAVKVVLDSDGAEQYVRIMSFSTGVLIFLGSRSLGLTFADLMIVARAYENIPMMISIGGALPFIFGILVTKETIHVLKKGGPTSVRIMLLLGVFTISQAAYTNYVALAHPNIPFDQAFIPNLCYSISVGLWLTFRYKEDGQR